MLTLTHAPRTGTINPPVTATTVTVPRKKVMLTMKTDLLLFIATAVTLAVGVVVVNTAGVSYLNAAKVELPPMFASYATTPEPTSFQGTAPDPAPAQPAPAADNTALWIALISSLTINFFNLISGMFNSWMQYKQKELTKDMQMSLAENTIMTQQTKVAVKEQAKAIEEGLADKSNH